MDKQDSSRLAERGYSHEDVTDTIQRRMPDYVRYITPQFSRTDINLQRIPTVDTSNPFAAREVPTLDESLVAIRFADVDKFNIYLPYLMKMIHGSFASRRNCLLIPGGRLELAMEIMFAQIVQDMIQQRSTLV